MKNLLFYCLSVVFSVLSSTASSQNEDSDAVYLQLTKEYTLNPDGSVDFRFIKKQKLLTYRSFNSLYGESSIVYNPDWQVLKMNDVYTIMADGKKVIAPKNALNEVLPDMAVNAPAYNNLREMVITHTGTERNAILNLDYEIHSKKGFYPALMGNEVLAETEPVKKLIIRIKTPIAVKLNYKGIHTDQSPVIKNEGLFRIYEWKFNEVPPISTEEFQPSNNENDPRLIFSTEIERTNIYARFQHQPAFEYTPDDEMKKAVKEITSVFKETPDILLKLQEKVVNEFKLWPITLRYSAFRCRTASEIWHSNGGTLPEKTILLISLLKEAGITATPVAVIRKEVFDEKIGSLLDIEEFLVKADLKETGPIYLSLNSLNRQDLKYSFPDYMFVEFESSGKTKFNNKGEKYTNMVSCKFDFKADEKKQISGEVSVSMVNGSNPWLQLKRDKGKDKSIFTGGIGATDLKDQAILESDKDESFIRYTIRKDKPFRKDSNYYFFTLPVMSKGIESWGIRLLPKSRITALEIPSEMEESYEYTFELPEGMSTFSPDKKLEINNATGYFYYESKADKAKVTVTLDIQFKKTIIPPSEYSEFKELMDNWNNNRYREFIFVQ